MQSSSAIVCRCFIVGWAGGYATYAQELWKFHYFHPGEVEEETLILPGSLLATGPAPVRLICLL